MKKTSKKGFTIVELVIVIAVIAILAAVLIPTFSSLINKAKLNADTQAVREMNVALAADEKLHGKPQDIDTAMRVLANAGYNSKNWTCLTVGYEVYWDNIENRCVLYNSTTAQIEFPANYDRSDFTTYGAERFLPYNNNFNEAISQDLVISSSAVSSSGLTISSLIVPPEDLQNASSVAKAQSNIASALTGTNANLQLKSALGFNDSDNLYINAAVETKGSTVSTGTYAAMVKMIVTEEEVIANSDGKVYNPNVYSIGINVKEGASEATIKQAQKDAANMVYSLFVQANATTNVDKEAAIVIQPGTQLDASAHEWQAINEFAGYFGSTDANNPVIISGARLSTATGYASMRAMQGSGSKYFMGGFIGALYGNATVENVRFTNLTIKEPGADFVVDTTGKFTASRNTVAIIGGILTDKLDSTKPVDVTIRNVVVDSSCKIIGKASVGGIVGYIGGLDGHAMKGSIMFENCVFSGTAESLDNNYVKSGYSPVGGIFSFITRTEKNSLTVTLKNCKVDGTMKGYGRVGTMIGNILSGVMLDFNFIDCDVSNARCINMGLALDGKSHYENEHQFIGKPDIAASYIHVTNTTEVQA